MKLTDIETIGQLASEYPESAPVLERLRIDYCCGGGRSVSDACRDAEITVEELETAIRVRAETTPSEQNWTGEPAGALVRHILDVYHARTRNDLLAMIQTAERVSGVHGENHPEVVTLYRLVESLVDDLTPHMMKEEQILFPYIAQMESAASEGGAVGPSCFGSIENPVRAMMFEHEQAGALLAKIREVTSEFTPPEDACASFRTLYRMLEEFEHLTHMHIHLENNILFPRVIEMEKNAAPVGA